MGAGPVSGVLSGGAQYYAGREQLKEARSQANLAEQEAMEKARLKGEEGKKFMSEQAYGYLKSGVMLEGSPMLVLEESKKNITEDMRAIKETGKATASSLRRQGRAAYISGILQGSASVTKGFGY